MRGTGSLVSSLTKGWWRIKSAPVENSLDLICTHDLEGRLLSMNEEPARILGYTREELIGRRIVDELAPEYRDQYNDYIARLLRDGRASGLLAVQTKSGERRIWEYDNTLGTDGLPFETVSGMARDVTERVRTERSSRKADARMQALLTSIDDIVFEFDSDGTCLNAWTANEDLLICPREELLGKRVGDVLGEELFGQFRETFRRVTETGRPEEFEYPLEVRAGKRWFVGRIGPIPSSRGQARSLCMLVRDITETKHAEEELQRKEATIRALFSISAKALNATLDVDAVLDTLVIETKDLVGVRSCLAALRTPNGFVAQEIYRDAHREPFEHSWPANAGCPAWMMKHKRPYVTNHAARDPLLIQRFREMLGARTAAYVSLFDSTGMMIAFIALYDKRDGSDFNDDDLSKAVAVGLIASIAVQNALAYRKIQLAEEHLRHLSTQLLQSQDEERRRTAQFLHETTGQSLLLLKMNLARAARESHPNDAQLQDLLNDSLDLVESSMQEIRTLSYVLHPPMLDEAGLASALRWYAKGFSERSGIYVHVEVADDFGRLPSEVEITLFRIVQEALTNVHRHSGSISATIRMERQSSLVILEVRDYGKGLAAKSAAEAGGNASLGVGIAGMRERVKQLGGVFSISSIGDAGMTVRATLPLPAAEKSISAAAGGS
ncbi:MAG: PAS domain S-box protein [Candidatus Acidiferrales bacterium]